MSSAIDITLQVKILNKKPYYRNTELILIIKRIS